MLEAMHTISPFKFDPVKALEVILYIANRAPIPDVIHLCKIQYFADKYHLEQYGRFVCGDNYVAMKNGPVPSRTYDIIKAARNGEASSFAIQGYQIVPFRDADLQVLSESDVESLDDAISKYGKLPIHTLIKVSHDAAWKSANENSEISVEDIAATLEDSEAIIEHLRNM